MFFGSLEVTVTINSKCVNPGENIILMLLVRIDINKIAKKIQITIPKCRRYGERHKTKRNNKNDKYITPSDF